MLREVSSKIFKFLSYWTDFLKLLTNQNKPETVGLKGLDVIVVTTVSALPIFHNYTCL